MTAHSPFNPHYTSGQTVNVTSAAASSAIPKSNKSVRIANLGTKNAYVRCFDSVNESGTVATTADTIVLPGNPALVIEKSEYADSISYICGGSDSTSLHVQTGEGGQ